MLREEDVVIFKISEDRLKDFDGSYYEGGRRSWIIDLPKYPNLKHAVIVKKGENVVVEVYNITGWDESDETPGKKMFSGERNPELEKVWFGKLINHEYRKQGLQGGRVYANSKNLLEIA